MTQMVLVNAIYFKGLWETPFEKEFTRDMDFWLSNDQSIKVPMMSVDSYFPFNKLNDMNANVLVLDYKVSFLVYFL